MVDSEPVVFLCFGAPEVENQLSATFYLIAKDLHQAKQIR